MKNPIGRRIRIYWPSESAWFYGNVARAGEEDGTWVVEYDDGDEEVMEGFEGEGIEFVGEDEGREESGVDATTGKVSEDGGEGIEEGEGEGNGEIGGESEPQDSFQAHHDDFEAERDDFQAQQDNFIDTRNDAITSSLQKALEEINISSMRQEQDDQEAWLRDFFEGQRREKEELEKEEMERKEEEEEREEAEIEMVRELERESAKQGEVAPINVRKLFIDDFTKAANRQIAHDNQIENKNKTFSTKQRQQPPETTGRRRFNAASEGCALLQGSVLSARDLPGSEVEVCNPFVKILFVEGGSDRGGNGMLRCKTPIHTTEVLQDTHNPAWGSNKFSMELLPPGDSWDAIRGDIMFSIYDVKESGATVFVGEASVSLRELIGTTKEDGEDLGEGVEAEEDIGLRVPDKIDRWLPLLSRAGKRISYNSEIHIVLKAYLPSVAYTTRFLEEEEEVRAKTTQEKVLKKKQLKRKALPTNIKSLRPTYKSHHKKFQRIRDMQIQKENVRLKERIDKLKSGINGNSGGGSSGKCYELVPTSLKTSEDRRSENRRRVTKAQNKENELNALLELELQDGRSTYQDYTRLQRKAEKLADLVGEKRSVVEALTLKVNKVEGRRRKEAREVKALEKFVRKKEKEDTTTEQSEEGKESEEKPVNRRINNFRQKKKTELTIAERQFDSSDFIVTPRQNDLKNAHMALLERRSAAIASINAAKLSRANKKEEIAEVREKIDIAKKRIDDPESDRQLASAHREVARLLADVETLKYEKKLGWMFIKDNESEVQYMKDQIKELKAKEERKRDKVKLLGFERAAAREEYKSWLDEGGSSEIANAAMILTNAIEVQRKVEELRNAALEQENAH